MRKVKVFRSEFSEGKLKKIDLRETGKFHRWAQDFQEFESGPGHFPVAIIEMIPSGEVRKIEPEYIQFIDEEEALERNDDLSYNRSKELQTQNYNLTQENIRLKKELAEQCNHPIDYMTGESPNYFCGICGAPMSR